ncbi:MAG: YkvA family protein [Sumerlaeia bacterium]
MSQANIENLTKSENRQKAKGKGIGKRGVVENFFYRVGLFRKMVSDSRYSMSTIGLLKIGACLVYTIWPLDLIPDFILGIGQVDDLIILSYGLSVLNSMLSDYEAFLAKLGASGNSK